MTDSYFVSRLGTSALAALTAVSFCVWIADSLAELASIGLYSEAARAAGMQDSLRIRRAVGHGLLLSALMGIGTGCLIALALPGYLSLLGIHSGEVHELARTFLTIAALDALPMALFHAMAAAFRAVGNARAPLWIFGGTLALNALLDPLLIFGVGSWPGWGMTGAAVATLCAHVVAAGVAYALLVRVGLRPVMAGVNFAWIGRMARIGLPISLYGVCFSLVYTALGRVVHLSGPAALAALGIGHRIEGLGFLTCVGFSVAATTLVGQLIGAGDIDRAEAIAHEIARAMMRVMLPAGIVMSILAPWLVLPFSSDPDVLREATLYLRFNGAVMGVMGLEIVYQGGLAATGRTLPSLLISLPLTLTRVPLAAFAALWLELGATGVWMVIALTSIARGLGLWGWFRLGRWKRGQLPDAAANP